MTQKITATRSNMARLQTSLKLARRGHSLLEQKRKILMNELMSRINDVMSVQRAMHEVFERAYLGLQLANISMGIDNVKSVSLAVPEEQRFIVRLRSIMGVDIPEADPLEPNHAPAYSIGGSVLGTSSVLDNAYINARELAPLLLRLAEVETTVYRLAIQIRKTMRRVNALEKVFIPRTEAQIRQIAAALDENEREDLTRIKLSLSH